MIRPLIATAAVLLVATACSGVPTSSSPKVLGHGAGAVEPGPQPTDTPQPDAEARDIVRGFLRANVSEPSDPRGPHEFLTPDEQRKWSDRTVTILQGTVDNPGVGYATSNGQVAVDGIRIGTIAADGTYTPVPATSGGGGQPWSGQYGLQTVNGQWRISDAPDGLVVYSAEFATAYRALRLYFYDRAEQRLVPDVRYTALTSPQAILTWELTQLLAGPRDELDSAVRTELPSLPATARATVTLGAGSVQVELPGSSHLDGDTKRRLAAQLIATMNQVQSQLTMTITDGGVPIDIPNIPQAFTVSDVSAATGLLGSPPSLPVFYLDHQGRLVDADGKPVLSGQLFLTAVAVAARSSDDYYVAAATGTRDTQSFWIGRRYSGLRKTNVAAGALTRPSWAPGLPEAWVGDGAGLFRVGLSGRRTAVPTGLPPGSHIEALRLSPEGSRIAMVVQGPNGGAQLWVGAVVRTNSVQIDSIAPITPPSFDLRDVAWSDDMTLWVVGTGPGHQPGIWSVVVDGSNMTQRPSAGLPPPQAPDSITAAPGQLPWVSAGRHVFEQQDNSWEGPHRRTTAGTAPVYLE